MEKQECSSRIIVRKWINRLESISYDNSCISDCLSDVKNVAVQCKEDQQPIISLIGCIIAKSSLNWISSPYSETVTLEVLECISPDSKLLSLLSWLYELSVGSRLEFVVSLIEKTLREGCYMRLLLQECKHSSSLSSQLWDKLISCVASLPDHIANKFSKSKSFPMFHHEKFFVFIGLQICEVLETLTDDICKGRDVNTEFLSRNIGHFCLLRKCEHLFMSLLPLIIAKTKECYVWQRLVHKCFYKIPDRCLDSVLLHIFKSAPTFHCLSGILGDIVIERHKARTIILHKLLLVHYSNDIHILRNVLGYISNSASTRHLLLEVLLKLLAVWSSSSAIKHTPYEQHRYITAAILICEKHLNEEITEKGKQELLSSLMLGMKTHLESPDENVRTLGMIVGEKISNRVKLPIDKNIKLEFEYPATDETNFLSSLSLPCTQPSSTFYEEQMQLYRDVKLDFYDKRCSANLDKSTYTAQKSSFVEMAQMHNINLSPQGSANESIATPANDDTDSDDDDDLTPYNLPEETPFSNISKPLYVRDCMDGLIENKDREHMEVYLNAVSELVTANQFAAKEVAVELCKILLNLQDNYAIDKFNELRRNAIVSVVVCDPKPVSAYITDEFYSEHYNLQQRMDILDILVMASGSLSCLQTKEYKAKNEISEVQPTKELPWRQVVEQRIESKTRRFGKVRDPVQTSPDRFGPVAGCFFYPLMAGYDRRVRTMDLLGTDSIILGRLLYALGTILHSAANSIVADKMGQSLLEFVAQLRHHTEPFVRKACVYCVSMSLISSPTITQELGDATIDAREWLCDVISNDEDTLTQELAANCLSVMNNKLRQGLGMGKT